ncbi:TetR family transcriptional regulator C-terminal domain-containing protein [Plantactinospora sp. S1510]|uniref:TetR family transcriptional regulator C-terminal domain-containing protein n=2 Tax=Plantactinospora alkalitolerans TaxID=2789879 RepID=A0ABS0H634_9ACTN|nr:TetR family transcriptional regulator C-terminal domain-containing protein [Plantactinospora alkalitolerans]
MPKVVNPEARRLAVTEAVFRVICRDGLEGATLRNIAEEAGLAIGSVRHYFTGHTDLTVFALAALRDRVTARILGHVERLLSADPADPTVDQRAEVEKLLAEFLPLDEQRRQETVVWLEFVTAARTRPELQGHARELYDGMRMVVGRVLDRARRIGRLCDDLDIAVESERLSALLDGLAMNAVLQPDRLPLDMIHRILAGHLDSLKEPS